MQDAALKKKQGKMVLVPSIRLDDIVAETEQQHVFLLKVDTQGFEPSVFRGLTDTVQSRKVDFILFEFWPKGMDLMAPNRKLGDCVAGELLQTLVDQGYELYAMGIMVHPNSPPSGKDFIRSSQARVRPFHDMHEYCRWFYSLDEKYAGDAYKMGHWSDMLVRNNVVVCRTISQLFSTGCCSRSRATESLAILAFRVAWSLSIRRGPSSAKELLEEKALVDTSLLIFGEPQL